MYVIHNIFSVVSLLLIVLCFVLFVRLILCDSVNYYITCMYVWAVQTSGIALNLEIIKVGEHKKAATKKKIHFFISLMHSCGSHDGIL